MTDRLRAHPYVGPRGRDNELPNAREHLAIPNELSVGREIREAATRALPADAGSLVGHVPQTCSVRGFDVLFGKGHADSRGRDTESDRLPCRLPTPTPSVHLTDNSAQRHARS